MQTVSIFGCGWLGQALAFELEQHYKVQVSVRSELSYKGLSFKNKFLLNKNNNFYHKGFFTTNTLVIAIPPKDSYLQILGTVLSHTKKTTQIILCSSTSVYTQTKGIVSEEDTQEIIEPSLMLEAERLIQENRQDILILRLGGLMGYTRIAGKYTAGKSVKNDTYVNYIHRDDVVAIIKKCIQDTIKENIYNLVAPIHSSKKELYIKNSSLFNFTKTTFENDNIVGKQVSSKKLIKELKYVFVYQDPINFWT